MKKWLGIDAKVREAILDLEDYVSIGQYYGGFSHEGLRSKIKTILLALNEQVEINKRLNDENESIIRGTREI